MYDLDVLYFLKKQFDNDEEDVNDEDDYEEDVNDEDDDNIDLNYGDKLIRQWQYDEYDEKENIILDFISCIITFEFDPFKCGYYIYIFDLIYYCIK